MRMRSTGLAGSMATSGVGSRRPASMCSSLPGAPHLQARRAHGLTVRSVKGDFSVRVPATDDPGDIGPVKGQ
jgi:2-dehydropantoate 2-reductase